MVDMSGGAHGDISGRMTSSGHTARGHDQRSHGGVSIRWHSYRSSNQGWWRRRVGVMGVGGFLHWRRGRGSTFTKLLVRD